MKKYKPPEELAYEIPEIWSKDWFSDEDKLRVNFFASYIPVDVKSILDVGCGNGIFINHLKQNKSTFSRLCGVDRSEQALKHVQVEKYLTSINDLPFEDNEFDLVTSLEVLEHLPIETYSKGLDEITRIAKKYILIGVPFEDTLIRSFTRCPSCGCIFNKEYHLRSFDENKLVNLFSGRGFLSKKTFFFGSKSKLIPNLDILIGKLKMINTIIKDDVKFPSYGVCPACGYSNTKTISKDLAERTIKNKNSLKKRFLKILYKINPNGLGHYMKSKYRN